MVKKFLKQYEIFFKKAIIDLNMAKIGFKEFENGEMELDLEVIYFHLQQCSEKLLKSILDFNKIKFIKTHDLKLLIKLLKDNSISTIENVEKIIPLTDYAVEGRYAVIHDDLDDAEKFIVFLEEYIEYVKRYIK